MSYWFRYRLDLPALLLGAGVAHLGTTVLFARPMFTVVQNELGTKLRGPLPISVILVVAGLVAAWRIWQGAPPRGLVAELVVWAAGAFALTWGGMSWLYGNPWLGFLGLLVSLTAAWLLVSNLPRAAAEDHANSSSRR